MASRSVQKTNGARASLTPEGVPKSARAYTPIPRITTAIAGIMTSDRLSARSAMPSGGAQPPRR